MDIQKSIEEALHVRRKSQTWLAKEIGVTDAYVSAIVLGKRVPTLPNAAHMAKALGFKLSEFIALGE